MKTEHTPTPKIQIDPQRLILVGEDGPLTIRQLEVIVRAVNNFEPMREALHEVLRLCQVHDPQTGFYKAVDPYALHKAVFRAYVDGNEKAIAKAEGL